VMKLHLGQIYLYIVDRIMEKEAKEEYEWKYRRMYLKRKYGYCVGQRTEEEISKHSWREKAVIDHQVT
jgi:hypothetical protein